MTDELTTQEQALKPTLGEDITELFSRVAKLNDQMAAVLAPEWGTRMGILPEGHPLRPELANVDPEEQEQEQEQATPVDWEAVARQRERELKQVGAARHRAEAELRRYTEAESADAAAGSYASGQATLTITVTAPNPIHAVRWAGHVRDLVHAEFGGSMGLHSFIELEPGGRVESDFTGPLTGIEVRDPCPHCESSPTRIPRQLMAEHVATVRPEVREGGPGIPVADAEPVIVCTTACDEQHTYNWTCALFAGVTPEPELTAEEARALADELGTEPNNPAATDIETTARVFAALHRSAEETVTRVIDLHEQWVKAGPPPLGTPMSRWWDRRLVELRDAIHTTADQPARTTANNAPTSNNHTTTKES